MAAARTQLVSQIGAANDQIQEDYKKGVDAANRCDEAAFLNAYADLVLIRAYLEAWSKNFDGIQIDQGLVTLQDGKLKYSDPLLEDMNDLVAHVLGDLDYDIGELKKLKEDWDRRCNRPTTDKPVTPGGDVAKDNVQIVDTNTQEQVPGTIVTIPDDPKQPIPPPVHFTGGPPPPGTPPPPDQPVTPGEHDTVIVIPECHNKLVLTKSDLRGDTGFVVHVPPKPLLLTFPGMSCEEVNETYVEGALLHEYGVALPLHDPGDKHDWQAQPNPYGCFVRVFRYYKRPAEADQCPSTTTIPDRPQTPPPPGEGDIPQTPQGPPPAPAYAKSLGSWGQSYSDQWWLRAIDWLKADGTTALPEMGVPVTVAVIDTGVDLTHPDLVGAAWVNPPKSRPRAEPYASGFAGDLFGWNFIDENDDIRDFHGHGTVIAGIIAARDFKKFGIAGINPWARIMALKAVEIDGKGGSTNVARAIAYAVDHGAKVINISLGGDRLSHAEQAAIDYAYAHDVIVVVASGNQGKSIVNYTPAGLRHVVTVAAIGPDMKRASFSNWGAGIALAAPGVDILSLRARQTDLLMFERKDYKPGTGVVGGQYYRVTGSSFAAPMVAGAASLIWSARPNLTAQQVVRVLEQTARDIEGLGTDQFIGYGLIDIDAALKADPDVFVDTAIRGVAVTNSNGRTVVRVTGTANADHLKEAYIEIGAGEAPQTWKRVSRQITAPVVDGTLDDLDAKIFAGSKQWILRVIAVDQNGKQRQSRFKLTLG